MRVAYLAQDGEHSALALDGIVADCYRRWGGRFSLIVPCSDRKIPDAYWPWLTSFDPDIIYSYVDLGPEVQLEVHRRLNPSVYQEHRQYGEPRFDVFGFSPDYGSKPLSSLSTIFRQARYRRSDPATPKLAIIDAWHGDQPSRFLADNFGTYITSYGTSMFPPDASSVAELLTVIRPERLEDRRFGAPRDLSTVPDELAAFEAFASKRATSLSMSSLILAPKKEMRLHRWRGSFNLVVGESFADRVLFWNARLLIPNWLDRDLCCLRVTQAQLEDEAFFATLVTFLNNHNHVNDGTGGQTSLTVRSCSVLIGELEAIRDRLRSAKCWSFTRAEHVPDLSEMLPTAKDIEHASPGHRLGSGFNLRPDWTEFTWEPPVATPPVVPPDHLADAPARQHFTAGVWATDFVLEAEGPSPRFANNNQWLLPRAWRTADAFKTTFSRISNDLIFPARGNERGHFTQFESWDRVAASITVPSGDEAILHALCYDGRWVSAPDYRGPILPPARALNMSPSSEARYLSGVLGLTGGLDEARKFLLHPFLQKMFSQLGGTTSLPIEKVQPTVERLRAKRLRTPLFDLADDSERAALGRLIAKAAQDLAKPKDYIRYSDIVSQWAVHREAFWEANGTRPQGDPSVDWDQYERRSLEQCLADLRRRQILFQGHQWTCPDCHYRNWVELSGLSPTVKCAICHHETDAPISIEWLFRPNEFLIEALRGHSVLSLLWVLGAICDSARASFIYAGPSLFWFNDPDADPDAEADLLTIADGTAIVCEAKSSWNSVRLRDFEKLAELAERLRPDVALLAVMDEADCPNNKKAKFEEAQARLLQAGIQLKLMTLKTHPIADDPYLR